MTIDDERDEALAAASREGLAAVAREVMADRDILRAEVRRLRADVDVLADDRDRLAAALAEVREAAQASLVCGCSGASGCPWTPLHRALDATPADLAATRDARVRAEGAEAMRAEAARRLRNVYMRARQPTIGEETAGVVEAISSQEALRSEADRIERGGR